jgi:glucose 1-dehydrogenase/3-oxoacyl-[acyl-carrier protein] reductase
MGIGQGIAIELARQGAEVAVHYAHTEPEETVSEIEVSAAGPSPFRGT